ncbi:NrfD/PsrC family molybdoenzyme membrane anchor subunit [uncultured Senegalimassilia sp.]|uniref:NrfD/PsrC family molybdoenzyme membrane anchor subunit n=1 Tax=uncultured Senegalimassilia sp. TaxID=1714350 RepID=UPI0026731F3F|nr:NrfD/PsrC family molybdoenzyme membrane anchor subunit [uncultured Senegalimassilia sp.]
MKLSAKGKVGAAVLVALMVIGFCAYVFQLTQGLCVTGMSNGVSWGLYITCFMFFVGLSAGGLIVASSAHVFHIESFKRVAMPAVITSTVCICCAGAFILIDLGGIQRIWNMFVHLNFTSPLAWDMCVITTYLVINILDIVWLRRGDERKVQMLSYVALPVAILVHSVTAWIFGLEIAKEGWYSAIMAPIFVASAMDSGLALLMCVLAASKKAGVFDCGEKLFADLARLLATFIAVDAFFIGCELLTVAYPGAAGATELLGIMTSGATAPFFWFEILGGLLVPFLLLASAKRRQRTGVVVAASALVMTGVLCKRVWLLFTSFTMTNVYGAPGISSGSTAARGADGFGMWALTGSYMPTPVEVAVVIAVVSFCILGIAVLSKKLVKAA